MARDWKIQCCPKCGSIKMLNFDWEKDCKYCGYQLQDTEYYFTESVDHGNLKPEIQKAIFEKYIKNSSTYSEEAVKDREEKENWERSNLPSSYTPKNTPKCPICQSTNLSKITTVQKAGKIALFGIFGMGDNGKTWKCNNCGSKF